MRIFLNIYDKNNEVAFNESLFSLLINDILLLSAIIMFFFKKPEQIFSSDSPESLKIASIFQFFFNTNNKVYLNNQTLNIEENIDNKEKKIKEKKIFNYLKKTEYYDAPEKSIFYIANNFLINKVCKIYLNKTVYLRKYDLIILDGKWGEKTNIYHITKDKIIKLN